MSVKDRGVSRRKQSVQDELADILSKPVQHVKIVHIPKDSKQTVDEVIAKNHAAIVDHAITEPVHKTYAPRMPQIRRRAPKKFVPAKGKTWDEQLGPGAEKPIRVRGSRMQPGDIMRNGKVVVQAVSINIVATPGLRSLLKCDELTMIQFRGEEKPVVFTDTVQFFVVRPKVMQ